MVRALLRGERNLTAARMLGLVGLGCLLAASLGLTLDYRQQLNSVRTTIYHRCLQRQDYDQAAHDAIIGHRAQAAADLLEQDQLLALFARSVHANTQLLDIFRRKSAADQTALTLDDRAIAVGVIGTCKVYR